MGCRCGERREAIVKTAKAIQKGDGQAVASEVKFIAQSAIEDASTALRKSISQARVNLTRWR